MLGDDRQALVERDERLLVGANRPGEPLERADEEVADEPAAMLAARRLTEGLVERPRVPVRGLPLRVVALSDRKLRDESVVAKLLPLVLRVRDELIVAVHGRERPAWVLLQHIVDVAAEDGSVEGLGVWQVVRHKQKPAVPEPRIVPGDDVGKALLAAGVRVAVEDGVQHGHEMRLAGSERAVEVSGS
jgi:hypothetical protein